jgi:hypothetical protein
MLSLRQHLKAAIDEPGLGSGQAPGARAKKPLVAYVGAASRDNAGFQHLIGAAVRLAGARLQAVKLASPRAKVSEARAVLEDCDVVFVSGGDVDEGMQILQERGVLPLFRALGEAGRPMVGISAGSIMLGQAWVRFPPEPGDEPLPARGKERAPLPPGVFPCMGLAPVYVDAHAEEDDWAELRVLLRLLVDAGEPGPVGYGLTRKGGVCVEPLSGSAEGSTKTGVKVTPFGTPAPRLVVLRGKVVDGDPLALGSSDEVVPVQAASAATPPRRRAKGR